MLPHQQRVLDEKTELSIKTDALLGFINHNPVFKSLPVEEQSRLREQQGLMHDYRRVLLERIEAFPKE